ncbi:hypothetical protein Ahy_B04g071061 [Arachis hypogaea]|uniref:Uncharacterized protein n=1 Tax=Arachis hypogaea TaxID=3818 RepID=A0A444ZJZ1_ARAHY|nr:hypothetical protein Ahy_B04g071061 [Arachis hypogaea]
MKAEINGHMVSDQNTFSNFGNRIQKEEADFRGFQFRKQKTQSKKRKHIIEYSSSKEEIHSYDVTEIGTEIIEEFSKQSKKKKTNEEAAAQGMPEVNLANETNPLFQGQTDQSSVNIPSDSIVLIQLCLSSSQTISASPVPLFELSSPTDSTPQPQKAYESTPTVPPTPSKIDLAPEAIAAALLMMARTSSYVPREFLLLSFSLAFTDSSQEETQTQEGEGQPKPQVGKSLETTVLIEELDELVKKIAKSGEKTALDFAEDCHCYVPDPELRKY